MSLQMAVETAEYRTRNVEFRSVESLRSAQWHGHFSISWAYVVWTLQVWPMRPITAPITASTAASTVKFPVLSIKS